MEIRGFTVRGDVQGVGFRYWTREHARRLGLRGFVRNRPEGSVEVVAGGTIGQLDELAALLARGPSAARVQVVDTFIVTEIPPPGFEITR